MRAINPEELLSHADFVRHLSRSLVFDEHRAADIAQDTWLAALEHPPTSDKPVRAWIARVLSNFSRKLHRGEIRRRARERVTATPAEHTAPSAVEIASREEMRSSVVEAVQSLEEPWRSTILLRYYENLSHGQVAERLGVPLETMRTRLKKGLALLRQRLDKTHGNNRRKWQLALAPLAGIDLAGAASKTAAGSSSGALYAIFSSTTIKLALVTAMILGTVWVVLSTFPTERNSDNPHIIVDPGNQIQKENNTSAWAAGLPEAKIEQIEKETLATTSREVIWQGRLIDYDGVPKEGVSISLDLMKTYESDIKPFKRSDIFISNEKGLFKITGLVPGEYSLHLSFSGTGNYSRGYTWGDVTFDSPGVVEKDILVAEGDGTIVAGVFVDEITGKPMRLPERLPDEMVVYYVALYNHDFKGNLPVTGIHHETGRFCFRGIPPMIYDLSMTGSGMFHKYLPSFVNTQKTKIIDDLTITIPAMGNLRILFSGFTQKEIQSFQINFELEHGFFEYHSHYIHREDQTLLIPEGKGIVVFKHKSFGTASYPVKIEHDQVFEILVTPDDLSTENPKLPDITVVLINHDGSPLAGMTVGFVKSIQGIPNWKNPFQYPVTNSTGTCKIKNIEPGIWSAWCTSRSPVTMRSLDPVESIPEINDPMQTFLVHGIEILSSPEPDFKINLVLPAGKIRGVLCDHETGLPLEDSEILMRWIMIYNPDQGCRVNGLLYDQSGNMFELTGIKTGTYQLSVAAFGYKEYRSQLFSIEESQILDMGKIFLEPVGTMEIEVLDPAANPVRFQINWEGKKSYNSIFGLDGFALSPGRMVFGNLPFGTLEVKILAFGFKPKQISMEITPKARAKATVVLELAD